jgi:lipoprotein-releasing system ATP-binding protein
MTNAVLEAREVQKSFTQGPVTLEVLQGVMLAVGAGERLAIVGASGSGKTTLLQILGGLDRPTTGQVFVDGQDIHGLSEDARGMLRNRALGFVYQFHHLLPEFSALENVAMPLLVRRMRVGEAKDRAGEILERVGLGQRLTHRPYQLSGGERQRAAVARALVTQPKILLADEPTGNLDSQNGREILGLLSRLRESRGMTVLIATHDPQIAARCDRLIRLQDGAITDDLDLTGGESPGETIRRAGQLG